MQGDPHDGMTELDGPSCWQLLAAAEVGRLAVAVAGDVEIFPINFVTDHETIVFRTAEGTKFSAAVIGPRVAFEADGYDSGAGEAWSVIVKGDAREVSMTEQLPEAAFAALFPWHRARKDRVVRIVPGSISGRRFPVAAHPPY